MSCYRTDTSAWPVEIHVESFELVVFGHWKTSVGLVGEGSGWFLAIFFSEIPTVKIIVGIVGYFSEWCNHIAKDT